MSNPLTPNELRIGALFGFLQVFILPEIARWLCHLLVIPLWIMQFLLFFFHFLCTILIYHRFLLQGCRDALRHWERTLLCISGCLLIYYAVTMLIGQLISGFYPSYTNFNDQSIRNMTISGGLWIPIATVLLVPVAEEMLFRGVLFRGIYDRSPLAAWLISSLSFAAVHILGYIGKYDLITFFLALSQYLPAGLCLALAYKKSNTILAPILMHTLINFIGMYVISF